MPLPFLAYALGTAASALAANSAAEKTRAAMDAARKKAEGYQIKPLGNKLAQAYNESKLAENSLNRYQSQEAEDLARANADANYQISDYAPSGFAGLSAMAKNEGRTQDAIGRLGAKYAPMGLAQKQQTAQLAGEMDKYDYLTEQERKDRAQTLANIDLGQAMAENQNKNQMIQAAISLGSTALGGLKLPTGKVKNTTTGNGQSNFNFTNVNNLPKLDATKLYNNAMKPQYNLGGVMTKKLNPLQAFATRNLSGSNGSDFTQGVQFNGKPLFNQNQTPEYIGDTEYLSSVPINHGYGADNPNVGAKFGPSNPYAPQNITPHYNKSDANSSRFYTIAKNPWEAYQNPVLANAYNANMYYKPKGKYDVQLPIGYENFINDRNYR
jgi:hypothetical protein